MDAETPIYDQLKKEYASKEALEVNKAAFTPTKTEKESK